MANHHGSRLGRPHRPSRPAVQQGRQTARNLRVTVSPRKKHKKKPASEAASGAASGAEREEKSEAESGQAPEPARAAETKAKTRAKRTQKQRDKACKNTLSCLCKHLAVAKVATINSQAVDLSTVRRKKTKEQICLGHKDDCPPGC